MRRGTVREMLLCYKEALQGLQNLNPRYLKNVNTRQYIESHYFSIFELCRFQICASSGATKQICPCSWEKNRDASKMKLISMSHWVSYNPLYSYGVWITRNIWRDGLMVVVFVSMLYHIENKTSKRERKKRNNFERSQSCWFISAL